MNALDSVSLRLVETLDDAIALRSWLGERREALAIDTETCGLEWWHEPIRLAILADSDTGWAVPWERWSGFVIELLADYSGPIVFHNAKFDLHVLERAGIRISPTQIEDTLTASHLLDPVSRHGLKYLAARTFGPEATIGEQRLKDRMSENKWTWATVPFDEPSYWIYGALDGVLTARLWEIYRPQIRERFRQIYELEIATIFVLFQMEERGARIDLPYIRERSQTLNDFEEATRLWVEKSYGVSPASTKQVAERLIADGVPLSAKTDTGAWRLDDGVLSALDHPLARAVKKIREASKMRRTYFDALEAKADGDKIHCSIQPLGARTGRMSISDPPLQQLPRGTLVRDAFIPRENGALVSADFDQIELRLLAHFAKEKSMLQAINEGVDLHSHLAALMYGKDFTKDHRQIAKGVNFAKVYGSGPEAFARTAGIGAAAGEKIFRSYDEAYPGVSLFMKSVENVARKRAKEEGEAYLLAPSGRRHPIEAGALYRGVNYLVQGTAADVFKRALVDLDSAGFGDYLLLPIHDEIIADVPAEDAEEIAQEIARIMSDRSSFSAPLSVGAEVLPERWGDKYRDD